jgi:hypothetical protein
MKSPTRFAAQARRAPFAKPAAFARPAGSRSNGRSAGCARLAGLACCLLLAGTALAQPASAATFSDSYLQGRWTTGGAEGCDKLEHEQTVFHPNGTFTTEHGGKPMAVGFWHVDEDRLEMQILTTEASLAPALAEALPGDYHMLQVKALAFTINDNDFKMVQTINGELQGLDMVRCRGV